MMVATTFSLWKGSQSLLTPSGKGSFEYFLIQRGVISASSDILESTFVVIAGYEYASSGLTIKRSQNELKLYF